MTKKHRLLFYTGQPLRPGDAVVGAVEQQSVANRNGALFLKTGAWDTVMDLVEGPAVKSIKYLCKYSIIPPRTFS